MINGQKLYLYCNGKKIGELGDCSLNVNPKDLEKESKGWKEYINNRKTFFVKMTMMPTQRVFKGFTILASMIVGLYNKNLRP
jgi:hypothetical protein